MLIKSLDDSVIRQRRKLQHSVTIGIGRKGSPNEVSTSRGAL